MILSKYKLPNGNTFIWLGTGGVWGKSEGVDNAIILAGGDVLFLKTVKSLPLYEEKVKEDIKTLSCEEFAKKYDLPTSVDLWKELKEGAEIGSYPPFLQNVEERMADTRNMISMYITNILDLKEPKEKIKQLETIMHECQNNILKIKAEMKS